MDPYYENLVLEGGGSKGFAYIGALSVLEKLDHLKNIKRYAGSSVGSIFAVLLCIGFTPAEILKISYEIDLSLPQKCVCVKAYNIWSKMGIHAPSKLEREIRRLLTRKLNPEITLKELYKKTGKDLVIVSTNLNRKKAVYFHHNTFPEAKLIDVLISSVSIPIVFTPSKINNDYYVDGGLVDNYPIWVFNDLEKLESGDIDDIDKSSPIPSTTLGLKLLCCNEKHNKEVFDGRVDITNVTSYLTEIVNTLILQVERADITSSYIEQTIPIYVPDISFINFSVTREMIDKLVEYGKNGVEDYMLQFYKTLIFV